MRELTLTEYLTHPPVALTPPERDSLRALVPSLQISPTKGEVGLYDLTPGSQVGTATIGDLAVEIRPKLTELDRVLFLLSYALDPKSWRETSFRYGRRASLLEAIIPGFIAQLRRAFRLGVLQGYRQEEAALLTVRGRLRFDDQIRDRFGVFPPAEVRYDDFTEDIEINRLLKAALMRLDRLRLRHGSSKKTIREFLHSLEHVQTRTYHPAHLPEITFSRLNEHYRPAVRLAQLILRSSSIELWHGRVRSSCFLADMNKVFEDFVVVAIREALGLSEQRFPQNCKGRRLFLDQDRRVRLEPDLSWWKGDTCRFVGDVKYKSVSDSGIKHADLYQLLAYTVCTGLPAGLLIYAAGEGEPAIHEVAKLDKRLMVSGIDLSGSPSEILGQVQSLAIKITQLRAGARTVVAA